MRRNWNLKWELGSCGKLWGLKGATCVTGSSFRLDAIKVVCSFLRLHISVADSFSQKNSVVLVVE